jgi:hypothetical protein
MMLSCRLFSILAICAVLTASTATFAEPSTPPTTKTVQLLLQTPLWNCIELWHVVVGAFSALIVLTCISCILNQERIEREQAQSRVSTRRHKRLHSALALKLDTDNFSEAACRETAHENLDRILKRREAIQDAEAQRLLQIKAHEQEYRNIAAYAAWISDLPETEVIELLRQAEAWEYRVLREAELQNERGQSHATVATKTTCPSLS